MSTDIPRSVAVGGVYRHYKGPLYVVLFIAKDSNNDRNGEPTVVYMSTEGSCRGAIRVRHVSEFMGQVSLDDRKVNRFEYLYLARGL